MRLITHRDFDRQFKKQSVKIKRAIIRRLELFVDDPFHPLLHNHQLSGKLENLRSINITGDIRAVYDLIESDLVMFVAIGTHSQLYS